MYRVPSRYNDDDDDDDDDNIGISQPPCAKLPKKAPLREKQVQDHFALPPPPAPPSPPLPVIPSQQPLEAATEVTVINPEHILDFRPQSLDPVSLPASAESVVSESSTTSYSQSGPASLATATASVVTPSPLQSTPASTMETPQSSSRSVSGKGTIITVCVSRRRHKMYCGRTSLCLNVCLSVCPRPYAHTTARTRM